MMVMAVAAVTVIDHLLLPPTMRRPLRHQATTPTLLLVVAATKEAATPVTIAMIATSPRAAPTTTRSLPDPRIRIPPSAALTRSDHLRVISTSAQRSLEAWVIHTPATAQTSPDPEQTHLVVPPGALATIGHIIQMVIVGVVPIWEDALGGPL